MPVLISNVTPFYLHMNLVYIIIIHLILIALLNT